MTVLATASTVSAQWTGTLTWNAAGNANWSDANWQLNGSGANIAYINNAAFTFSGNFDAIGSGTNAGVTLTVLDGKTLYDGMVLTSGNLAWGTNNVGTLLSGNTYSFRENWNINTAGVDSAIVGSSDIVAQFSGYSGTVTVGGAQYAKELRFNNGGTVVLASNSGTFFLSPGPDSGTIVRVTDNTNVEIRVDIDNRHLATGQALHLRNQGTGILTLNGNALHAKSGISFSNNQNSVTNLNNVTLDNGGGNLVFSSGIFNFSGVTLLASTNNVNLNGNTTWNIAANAVVDLTNSTNNFRVGANNGSVSQVNIEGRLVNVRNMHIGADNGTIGRVTVSGTGQLLSTGADINISYNDNSATQGYLDIKDTGWVNGSNINVGEKGNTGIMTLANSGSATLSGRLHVGAGVVGVLNANGNTLVTAGQVAVGNTDGAYGVLNLDGNAKVVAGYFSFASQNNGYAEVNLRGNSSLAIGAGSFNQFYLGKTGTAVINVYDTASIKTTNSSGDFRLGESGGAGKATLNVHSGTVELYSGKYLYINENNDQNGSEGIINLSGGKIIVDSIVFGSTKTTNGNNKAHLNITGGELVINNSQGLHTGNWNSWLEANPTRTASDTQINLGGGKITTPNGLTTNMNFTLTGSGGNIQFNATNGATAQTITVGGAISGRGGLEVTAGTLLLKGVNTYEGQTVVDVGSAFVLDSAGSMDISLLALETDANRAAFDGGGSLTLNGIVNIDFTGATGTEWTLVSTSLTATVGDGWLSGFTKESDTIWTKDDYIFNLDTGLLSIPEPSTWLLVSIGASLLVVIRRLRR